MISDGDNGVVGGGVGGSDGYGFMNSKLWFSNLFLK